MLGDSGLHCPLTLDELEPRVVVIGYATSLRRCLAHERRNRMSVESVNDAS